MKTITLEQIEAEAKAGIHDAVVVPPDTPYVRGHSAIYANADRVVTIDGRVLKDKAMVDDRDARLRAALRGTR